ncbi:MAG: hypothetical protein ABI641_03670 [Caldimonas sp.]
MKPDGNLRYALGVGASFLAGSTITAASANVGGEGALGTLDSRWRFRGKALWSRSENGDSTSENVTVLLVEESEHRLRGRTWLRQRISFFPALRPGESLRGIVDAGLAMALSPLASLNFGVSRHYDGNAGLGWSGMAVVTSIAIRLR